MSGLGALATLNQVGSAQISDDAVTNAKLANMAAATFKGRAAGAGTGDPTDLTAAQAKSALAINAADVSGLSALATLNQVGSAQISDDAVTNGGGGTYQDAECLRGQSIAWARPSWGCRRPGGDRPRYRLVHDRHDAVFGVELSGQRHDCAGPRSIDTTKRARIDAGAVATATTRTIIMGDRDVDLAAGGTFAERSHTHTLAEVTDAGALAALTRSAPGRSLDDAVTNRSSRTWRRQRSRAGRPAPEPATRPT